MANRQFAGWVARRQVAEWVGGGLCGCSGLWGVVGVVGGVKTQTPPQNGIQTNFEF